MKSEQEIQEMLDDIEKDIRLTQYSVANVMVNAPLALEQVSLFARASMLRKILGLPHRQYHGRDEEKGAVTILNAPVEKIDLGEAYCPNCGPNHLLDHSEDGQRECRAWCEVCEWKGTCGDLLDLLAELDSDDEEETS